MFHDIIFLLLGLTLLVIGGNAVTDGSVAIAKRMHVSGLVVGLTVVALGSSVPDLVVGVTATISHHGELAVGDVVGAAIFDLTLVVGLTALVKPFTVDKITMRTSIPLMVLALLILFFVGDDRLIDGAKVDIIDRSDGLIFLTVFALFLVVTITTTRGIKQPPVPVKHGETPPAPPKWVPAIIRIVIGLGALVVGGNWIVSGASGLAYKAGWSEALVGLTIVAIGSSLPDLATSLIAAAKGETGIALGNVVGSVVFDSMMVLGTSSVIHPLNSGQISFVDYGVMVVSGIAIWLTVSRSKNNQIGRALGAVLTVIYIGYMYYLVATM